MALEINTDSYNKAAHYPLGHGYELRPAPPTSLVIHSTNNPKKNTSLASEAKYLFESAKVSADFLVGKDGTIIQFLDSVRFFAWHAGNAKPPWANELSIGIELHHSVGDGAYPVLQEDALTALARLLMARFHIPPALIETHRFVALPKGRKPDPNDWPDASFYSWRSGLTSVPVVLPPTPTIPDALEAATLPGPGALRYPCSIAVAGFYAARGGVGVYGYPVASETRATGLDGRICSYLPCERAVIKNVLPDGVHLALLSEALKLRWI